MRRLVWILASLAASACLPSTVAAYEDEATLGLSIGYAGLPASDGLPAHGFDFALSAGGGFGDAWSLQGFVRYDRFGREMPLHLAIGGLEALYALDIVRFVPLFGLGLDGLLSVRERAVRGDFALHVLLGVDFLINPRWIIGADVRGYWVATHAASPLDPFILTAGVRVSLRFGLE